MIDRLSFFLLLAALPINAETATDVHKSNFQTDPPYAAPMNPHPGGCRRQKANSYQL
jgi:hypothetical protein